MSAADPTRDASPSDAHADCGRPWRPGWFPWIPLGVVAALVVGAVVVWWLNAGPFAHGGSTYPLFWPLFPLGFFLVLLLVFLSFRVWGRGRPWNRGWHVGWSAREILSARYARGEISRDQLRQMMRDLDELE
ncbi:MAG: hypothetical protein ACREBZ_00270 [Thermoplasmata archaeon]